MWNCEGNRSHNTIITCKTNFASRSGTKGVQSKVQLYTKVGGSRDVHASEHSVNLLLSPAGLAVRLFILFIFV